MHNLRRPLWVTGSSRFVLRVPLSSYALHCLPQNDLDYIDDNAEKLGRQKMRSDAMKRQFAIHDYARTQKSLATCSFCFAEDDTPPKAPIIAMGTRVYLSCTLNEELVSGHCLIVPIQHHLNMLEGDDDVWDEVRVRM
jgi:hypothetical protein